MKNVLAVCLFLAFALGLAAQQTMPLGPYGQVPFRTGNTAIDTIVLTSGQMSGLLTGTPTAAANYTTPTATLLCRLFPFVGGSQTNNFWWDFYIKNTSGGANTITAVVGTGVTLVGTGTVAQSFIRHFRIVLTQCAAGQTAAAQLISMETTAF